MQTRFTGLEDHSAKMIFGTRLEGRIKHREQEDIVRNRWEIDES